MSMYVLMAHAFLALFPAPQPDPRSRLACSNRRCPALSRESLTRHPTRVSVEVVSISFGPRYSPAVLVEWYSCTMVSYSPIVIGLIAFLMNPSS